MYGTQGTHKRPFLRHMRELMGSQVDVSTICGMVSGKLAGVYMDHLTVDTPQGNVHIRLMNICWVRKTMPPAPPPAPPPDPVSLPPPPKRPTRN